MSSHFISKSTATLLDRYRAVRRATERLAEPLSPEDCTVQSMPDASPVKWHLAHTTWFFETFVLKTATPDDPCVDPNYEYLFNSYYEAVGPRHPRPKRGLLTRPSLREVMDYRHHVDNCIQRWLEGRARSSGSDTSLERLKKVLEVGLHHEQQHQELILTDIKHALFQNPIAPIYLTGGPAPAAIDSARPAPPPEPRRPLTFVTFDEGVREIGFSKDGFCFDNETPRHRVFVDRFEIGSRCVTVAEYLEFMSDGGYERPEFWLSDGYATVQAEAWHAPLYWSERDGQWSIFTLFGERPLTPSEPACHLSYYEADAYARWAGARLPTEAEWEIAAADAGADGTFAEDAHPHPKPAGPSDLSQMFGDVWEWTSSAYAPYPGYQPLEGALGEYNGKFMVNQQVLRGGSCATPRSHIRPTYRNFFYPHQRWQFSGVRLCRTPQA